MEKKNEMCLQVSIVAAIKSICTPLPFKAAWGLEYLHAKNVLHRDIAARNCLYGDNKASLLSVVLFLRTILSAHI